MTLGQQELGRRIRQAREDAGLTQSELADRLGLAHPQSISRYERGETEVPQKRLRRIGEVTEKPLSYFVAEASDLAQAEDADVRGLLGQVLEELRDLRARLEAQPVPPDTRQSDRAAG